MLEATLEALNPQQRQAVTHRSGPLLVLAGAGSGKTRVVTARIARLITEGFEPESILALTFTNKAAAEMSERVGELIGKGAASQVTLGTFHSVGLRILEREAAKIGLPKPLTLIDAGDQVVAIRQCLKAMRMDPKRHDPKQLLAIISNARHGGITPEMLANTPGEARIARLYRSYLDWLDAHRVVDFDDLILRPVKLLAEDQEARTRYQNRYRTVLVDEYQDTNRTQLELVRLICQNHRSLCVVGDDDQSIYGWRGACVDNILQFETHFADASVIRLEQNYRSTGHVLAVANAVISQNTSRREKRLWTEGDDGEPVKVVTCKDPSAEAAYVAAEIHRRKHDEHRKWSDFGVLFRVGAQARFLEEAMRLTAVPYKLVGVNDFYQKKEIKDVMAYLRLVHNPNDRAAFVRAVNFPHRGIGPKSLSRLLTSIDKSGLSPMAACARAASIDGLQDNQVAALGQFASVIESGRRRIESAGNHDIAGLVASICEEIRAREAWIRDPFEGSSGDSRCKNVEFLMDQMKRWQTRGLDNTLGDFLKGITLDARSEQPEEHADRVILSTIHSAKGLEWPICVVVGCQEGSLPHYRVTEEGGDINEERRLFYVAITRARKNLYLTRSRRKISRAGNHPVRPSRFLTHIPKEHSEHIDRVQGEQSATKEETKRRFSALLKRVGSVPE
jgi:DNA helicase-2/ATP-dependent DNA helicase PcrA